MTWSPGKAVRSCSETVVCKNFTVIKMFKFAYARLGNRALPASF